MTEQVARLRELLAPWANHNGPLPEYDHPAACVFDSGVQFTVELLAKVLGVEDWTPCDGTEEYEGDLGGTLMNIVHAAMPKDKHGDPISPSELPTLLDQIEAMREALSEARKGLSALLLHPRTSPSGPCLEQACRGVNAIDAALKGASNDAS